MGAHEKLRKSFRGPSAEVTPPHPRLPSTLTLHLKEKPRSREVSEPRSQLPVPTFAPTFTGPWCLGGMWPCMGNLRETETESARDLEAGWGGGLYDGESGLDEEGGGLSGGSWSLGSLAEGGCEHPGKGGNRGETHRSVGGLQGWRP